MHIKYIDWNSFLQSAHKHSLWHLWSFLFFSSDLQHVRIHRSIEVFLQRNCDGSTKEVKDDDVGDVQFGEEPAMVLGPVGHDRVPREQGPFGEFSLLRVLGNRHHVASEDDVGTSRVHWVIVLLGAVVPLKKKRLRLKK